MENYKIFESKMKVADRFTLINVDGDVFGFDEMPFHPLGFGQYCGNVDQWKTKSTKHLGKRITIEQLSNQARIFVQDRI
jgi:hypothetical protein